MESIDRAREADGERMTGRESVRFVAGTASPRLGRDGAANRGWSPWSGGIQLREAGGPVDVVVPVEGTLRGVSP